MQENIKKLNVAVFIDMSNMFHASKNYAGWFLRYERVREYLERKYALRFFRLYGCEDTNPSTEYFRKKAIKQQHFYANLISLGFDVFKKPLQYIDGKINGDIDSDIKKAMREYMSMEDIEEMILFSGDKHFLPTIKECCNNGKFVHIYSFKKTLSKKIRKFQLNNPKKSRIYILDKKRMEFGKIIKG